MKTIKIEDHVVDGITKGLNYSKFLKFRVQIENKYSNKRELVLRGSVKGNSTSLSLSLENHNHQERSDAKKIIYCGKIFLELS